MTIKEYRENTPSKQQKEFARKLQCWLGKYTNDVYRNVMSRMEEIINNEMAMKLIDELYTRTQKEIEDEIGTIQYSLGYNNDIEKYGLHNHCLTHSESYRNILYDMFIRETPGGNQDGRICSD